MTIKHGATACLRDWKAQRPWTASMKCWTCVTWLSYYVARNFHGDLVGTDPSLCTVTSRPPVSFLWAGSWPASHARAGLQSLRPGQLARTTRLVSPRQPIGRSQAGRAGTLTRLLPRWRPWG